jgi:hypothetical protein
VSTFGILAAIFASALGVAALYALVRVPWRLWKGDEEVQSAGRDSDTWRRARKKRY